MLLISTMPRRLARLQPVIASTLFDTLDQPATTQMTKTIQSDSIANPPAIAAG